MSAYMLAFLRAWRIAACNRSVTSRQRLQPRLRNEVPQSLLWVAAGISCQKNLPSPKLSFLLACTAVIITENPCDDFSYCLTSLRIITLHFVELILALGVSANGVVSFSNLVEIHTVFVLRLQHYSGLHWHGFCQHQFPQQWP